MQTATAWIDRHRLVYVPAVVVALSGCNPRGGRRVVLMPDEIAGRRDDRWRVTQEPAAGEATGRPQAAEPAEIR
jgi:hypothetical protein